MNFKKVNNITGWAVFAIASLVYILTREATASLWDTGEFIASAYKMQLPHPPGAPTFLLLGRFFIILFGGDNPANAVNLLSALASSFSILFLFWTITHFARKMFVTVGEQLSSQQMITVMGAGAVGALAYTFSDSFWFSAVEGEVYALSSFFTALVFWAMLKWEHASDLAGDDRAARFRADRWIVFIFFMMGLSIGVHLLNLLTIPAIVMIYYFKRYQATTKGGIIAFILGCIITGVVQVAMIKWSVKFAGKFDIWFVNGLGLPFFSGFIFFFVLLAILIWLGLRWAQKNGWSFLRLGLWCLIFMMIGYSTYITTMVRSNANPAIDMNNVDNPMSLVYYLGREQYGSAPLLYGPHFAASIDDVNREDPFIEGSMSYVKGDGEYIPIGRDREYNYSSDVMQVFPRVWDPSNDQNHAEFYADWLGLERFTDQNTGQPRYEAPTVADNFQWFFTYQMGLMYWRYFMWNFSGKQNDLQGFGSKRDGNWLTGIPFIDKMNLGDQQKLPDNLQKNKAHNELYLIPFVLGILGCVFQFLKNRKDWIVTFLLFFFTGLAIVLYLNQPGNQPRERDYAYVGSFYAFAIWIGLAVVGIVRLAREKIDRQAFLNTITIGGGLAFLITLFSLTYGSTKGAFLTGLLAGGIYAAVTAIAVYIARAVSSAGSNARMLNIVAIGICLLAPVLMGMREWDDHDRSRKTVARDIAINYLESCAPNAILFTFGDNDTYPLWYAQEVEGVRPDIRIINNSLLGIDWYVNQLRYKVNESDSIDIIWTKQQIEGHNREYMQFQQRGSATTFYDLYDVMKNVLGKDELDPESGRPTGPSTFPVKRFKVPVNRDEVLKYGTVNPGDTVLSQMEIDLGGKNVLFRNELIILNIIAANKWKRPIYFTHPYGELGLGNYLRKDGLTYRLVPVKNTFPQFNWTVDVAMRQMRLGSTAIRDNNPDWIYNVLMNKFRFGGANLPGIYFDEENRKHMQSVRSTFAEAAGNLADAGKKDEGNKLLMRCEEMIRIDNLPYAMTSRYNQHNQTALIYLEAAYKVGNGQLAEKVRNALRRDFEQQKQYYDYMTGLGEGLGESMKFEKDINEWLMVVMSQIEAKYNPNAQGGQQVFPNVLPNAADTTHQH